VFGPNGLRRRLEYPNMQDMSLYYVQKLLYQLNRDASVCERYETDFNGLLAAFDLTAEEIEAIKGPDLGLLYVMGVNGQILVSYAAMRGFAWPEYIKALQEGLKRYGPVRAGVYAETGYEGVERHTAAILARKHSAQEEAE